jgi:hypothetical protein
MHIRPLVWVPRVVMTVALLCSVLATRRKVVGRRDVGECEAAEATRPRWAGIRELGMAVAPVEDCTARRWGVSSGYGEQARKPLPQWWLPLQQTRFLPGGSVSWVRFQRLRSA